MSHFSCAKKVVRSLESPFLGMCRTVAVATVQLCFCALTPLNNEEKLIDGGGDLKMSLAYLNEHGGAFLKWITPTSLPRFHIIVCLHVSHLEVHSFQW